MAVVFLCPDTMAVAPGVKWPAQLLIAEETVCLELRDLCQPVDADRREGNWAKADLDLRAFACCLHQVVCGVERGDEVYLFQPHLLPCGHKTREVLRIGKEGKDNFHRIGQELLGVEAVRHQAFVYQMWSERVARTKKTAEQP